jgi:hypothetical protein
MNHACKEASKLASDGLDRKLSLWERLKLQIHMSMCGKCKNCNETIKLIRKTAKLISQSRSSKIRLTDKQRESLHKALDEKRNCD